MDVAMRVQPRERGDSYLNRQRGALPEDSGNECELLLRGPTSLSMAQVGH